MRPWRPGLGLGLLLLAIWASPLWAGAKEDFFAAQAAYLRDEHEQALGLYAKALETPQTPPGARARAAMMMGLIHLRSSRWQPAREAFAACLGVTPREPLAHVGLGRAWYGAGRWEEAAGEFSQALEIKPDLALALLLRSLAWERLGEKDKAAADRARAWQPRRTQPSKVSPGQAEEREAADSTGQAQAEDPARAHLTRARQFYGGHADQQALAELALALALRPRFLEALYLRGLIQLEGGALEQAAGSFGEIIEMEPSFSLAYLRRGQAWQGLARPDLALADWDLALAARLRPMLPPPRPGASPPGP